MIKDIHNIRDEHTIKSTSGIKKVRLLQFGRLEIYTMNYHLRRNETENSRENVYRPFKRRFVILPPKRKG